MPAQRYETSHEREPCGFVAETHGPVCTAAQLCLSMGGLTSPRFIFGLACRLFCRSLPGGLKMFYAHTMEFKVLDLEREPIEFDLELKPGAVRSEEHTSELQSLRHL